MAQIEMGDSGNRTDLYWDAFVPHLSVRKATAEVLVHFLSQLTGLDVF